MSIKDRAISLAINLACDIGWLEAVEVLEELRAKELRRKGLTEKHYMLERALWALVCHVRKPFREMRYQEIAILSGIVVE